MIIEKKTNQIFIFWYKVILITKQNYNLVIPISFFLQIFVIKISDE